MTTYFNLWKTKTLSQQAEFTTDSPDQTLLTARKEAISQQNSKNTTGGFKWLNEYSRKFLESGYLTEGISPERRIYEIAERAEQILQMPGYADKFYNYMSEGYFLFGFSGLVKFWQRTWTSH